MPNLIETAEQQIITDTVLHAASSNPANNKDEKIALVHNLGVSREPDDAHRELNSLGFIVTRASTTTHQNVAKPGSTRQLAPKGNQTWKYNHPSGFKAEMNMRDSGNTSVAMNAPRATHERFRTRMDMKPHPAFKKMDADSAKEKGTKKKGKVSAGADFDVRKMKDPLYAASTVAAGGPGSGRRPEGGTSVTKTYKLKGKGGRNDALHALHHTGFKPANVAGDRAQRKLTVNYTHPDGHSASISQDRLGSSVTVTAHPSVHDDFAEKLG